MTRSHLRFVAGFVAAAFLLVGHARTAPARARLLTPSDVTSIRRVRDVAIAPDGTRVAWRVLEPVSASSDAPDRGGVYVADSGGAITKLADAASSAGVGWTPNGSSVAFVRRIESGELALVLVAPDGRESLALPAGAGVRGWSFAPDGKQVALLASRATDKPATDLAKPWRERPTMRDVWIASTRPGDEPRRVELGGSAAELHWSPAGDTLALTLAPSAGADDHHMRRDVALVAADTAEVTRRLGVGAKLGAMAWSPDGARLAFVAGVSRADPRAGRPRVVEVRTGQRTDVLPGVDNHVRGLVWSGPKRLIYLADVGTGTEIGEVEVGGTARRVLLAAGDLVVHRMSRASSGALALAASHRTHPADVFVLDSGARRPRRVVDHNPWIAERALGRQRVVRYASPGGVEIEAIVVEPVPGHEGGDPSTPPLVVLVHGGPESHIRDGWTTTASLPAQVLAGYGYAVLMPNYRGSTGRGPAFSMMARGEPGDGELRDLFSGVEHVAAEGLGQADRVAFVGTSYGGYLSAMAATREHARTRAAVSISGYGDLVSALGTTDLATEHVEAHLGEPRPGWWREMLARSPITHAAGSTSPLLLLHGERDSRLLTSQAKELLGYRRLGARGVPTRLVLYPDEGHGFFRPASRLDLMFRTLRWMTTYLDGAGGPLPPFALGEAAAPTGDGSTPPATRALAPVAPVHVADAPPADATPSSDASKGSKSPPQKPAKPTPPISGSAGILFVLAMNAALWFWAERRTGWAIFTYLPPLVFIYMMPAILSNTGLIPLSSPTYDWMGANLLPLFLTLLLLDVDVAAAVRVMGRGIGVMLAGTAGVVVGAPIAYALVGPYLGPDTWMGYGALAGSWIGGTGNMAAVAEGLGTSPTDFGLAVIADHAVYLVWLPILLASKQMADRFHRFTGVDRDRLTRMKAAADEMIIEKGPAEMRHLVYLLGIGFLVTWVATELAAILPVVPPVLGASTWKVLLVTTIGLLLSRSPARLIPGSHALAMALVYLFVARMGAKASVEGLAGMAVPFVSGAYLWIAIHGAFLLLAARLLRVDVHTAAISSAANIGGAASAPIVAAHHDERLVPVSILMALIGYAVGNYAAFAAAWLCSLVA